MSKKKSLIIAVLSALGIAIITLVFLIFRTNHISDFERVSFEQSSAKIMNYIEAIDNDIKSPQENSLDKYITFALLYSANEEQKYNLNASEIKSIIENNFDIEADEHAIEFTGITEATNHFRVTKDPKDNSYTIKSEWDKKEVARRTITKYTLQSLKKSGNKYTATYKKYENTDPYAIFTYANYNHLDTKGFGAYLENGKDINLFRNVITDENAEELAEYKKDLTVIYVLKDNHLVVKEIK